MAETNDQLEVGDRVVLRGAEEAGRGTITQLLEYGMVRVLWEPPELTAIHRSEQLSRVQEP
jgi:hypothetical protein